MTRKHFEAIAAALKATKPDAEGPAMAQWRRCVSALRGVCVGFNGNFDGNRFLDACGFDD